MLTGKDDCRYFDDEFLEEDAEESSAPASKTGGNTEIVYEGFTYNPPDSKAGENGGELKADKGRKQGDNLD